MRRVAALLLWGLIGTAHATEQIPDRIQIDGRDAALLAEPLSAVLDDQATWQRFVARARQALGGCSANWRGYQAYWRLDGVRLLLDRVVIGACAAKLAAAGAVSAAPGAAVGRLGRWRTADRPA